MQPIIEIYIVELRQLCRRFHVRRLEVFGSAARGDFDPQRSDVDFLVEFEAGARTSALDTYFGLKEALEALLGRSVDLVVPGAIENPYLKRSIEESRETVYAAYQPQDEACRDTRGFLREITVARVRTRGETAQRLTMPMLAINRARRVSAV